MSSRSIKKNTIYNAIKTCSGIVFPLITFPYVSRVLLAESLGKINFSSSIVGYFSLIASLGVSTYAVRECSKVKDDSKRLSITASEIYTINAYSTLIACALLLLTLLFARRLDNYRTLILIQSSGIVFTTFGADWINNVAEDFGFITLRTLGFNILSVFLMFMLVKKPDDYITYAVITLVASMGANVTNILYRRKYCRIRLVRNPQFGVHLKPIMMLFSLQLIQTIYVSSDVTILGLVRTVTEVGWYSAAVKIYSLIQTLMNSVVLVVLPQLSQAYANEDYIKANGLLRYSLNFIVGLGLPCLIGVNVVAPEVIMLLAGESFLACVPSLRILTFALFWSFLGGFLGNLIMIPSGREDVSLASSVVSAIVNLVLNLVLIPRWGIEAAAATTTVSMAIGFFYKLPFVDRRVGVGPMRSIVMGPIVGCFAIVLIGLACNRVIPNYFIRFTAIVALSVVGYFICLLACRNELGCEIAKSIVKLAHAFSASKGGKRG